MSARPIIGAVDAFDRSPSAARCAGWLADALGAPLELVHVLDPGALPALSRAGAANDPVLLRELYERQEETARIRALAQLEELSDELPDVDVSRTVIDGPPAATLQELAVTRGAALLVTGTAARKGVEHVLQGSVAGRVVAGAPCPVVTVPPEAAVGESGPVLVGDDGSGGGGRAVRHAAGLADRLGRDLVRMRVEDGDAVEAIGEAARAQQACLVVAGNRGRGPMRAELFGSVSIGLVQTARRPIVLVPATAGEPAVVAR